MGYSAAAGYPAALQEAVANGIIRPGAQGLQDAQEFTRAYAKATGVLNGVPRELQVKFARIAAGANQNVVTAVTSQHSKEIMKANQVAWESHASNIVEATSQGNIGGAFDNWGQMMIVVSLVTSSAPGSWPPT